MFTSFSGLPVRISDMILTLTMSYSGTFAVRLQSRIPGMLSSTRARWITSIRRRGGCYSTHQKSSEVPADSVKLVHWTVVAAAAFYTLTWSGI